MKKAAVALAFILVVGVNFSRAAEMESLKGSSPDLSGITLSDLQKDGITGVQIDIPLPSQSHNTNYGQTQTFRFESGFFTFRNDAERAMNDAISALQRANYPIIEKNIGRNTYTLAFLAPSYTRIAQYKSGQFTFPNDAQRAADESAAVFESRGMVVLEKNVNRTSFTINYLTNPYTGQMQTFRFGSGSFTYTNDMKREMNDAISALRIADYPILEKNTGRNTYTLVFLAPSFTKLEQYISGQYTYQHDAEMAANEATRALASRGMVILEKNVNRTSFTINYLNKGWHYRK